MVNKKKIIDIKKKVLLLGYGSQLSICLKHTIPKSFKCINYTRKELDINNSEKLFKVFNKIKPDVIINTAAITDVDFCEKNPDICFTTNAYALKNISIFSKKINALLIHFSSDFVHSGKSNIKYKEVQNSKPVSIYGKSKLLSEKLIKKYCDKFIIFRISMLYSNYGNNFYKNIIKLLNSSKLINVYKYQRSNPTNAIDFSKDIWSILEYKFEIKENYGIYNYSSSGIAINRYEFAKLILKYIKKYKKNLSTIKPIDPTIEYKKIRPKHSSLNINKVSKTFNLKKINHSIAIKRSIEEYYLEYKHLKL